MGTNFLCPWCYLSLRATTMQCCFFSMRKEHWYEPIHSLLPFFEPELLVQEKCQIGRIVSVSFNLENPLAETRHVVHNSSLRFSIESSGGSSWVYIPTTVKVLLSHFCCLTNFAILQLLTAPLGYCFVWQTGTETSQSWETSQVHTGPVAKLTTGHKSRLIVLHRGLFSSSWGLQMLQCDCCWGRNTSPAYGKQLGKKTEI